LKKIVTVIGLLVVSLLFTGCGNKVSFKAQEPLENAALVYVYVTQNVGTEA
jgi:hypothetical protein